MARSISPGGYSNYEDDSMFQNAAFTHDISEQMRVPKRIRATGDYYDDQDLLPNGNGEINSWNYHNKIDMTVPDRIVVLGQDQHLVLTSGTKSAPREIMLENSILPKDPGFVRVSTPPRVITLSEHHFPSASDEPEENAKDNNQEDNYGPASLESIEDPNSSNAYFSRPSLAHGRDPVKRSAFSKYNNELTLTRSMREETPTFGGSVENLTPSEELTHLRRQVAKINRRLLAVEIDSVQRQQREKIIYCVGMAYFLFKTFMWLSRK
ncbi:transport and Golgi organization protein 11 isoform X1 [Anopheles stephensi]|uniref:transport and Golgi organization protein 11 isoform X1 n=1 Tax=Anopheles stephensi TaxID=30069 RepID=UPI001658A5A1|nr:transport and Golgi organization protein 11 isoform X1 [Anopheles stephensi]